MRTVANALVASGLLLAPIAADTCQATPINHPGTAFSNAQALNTTILGTYGHSPAVYPSPNITGNGGWEEAMAKAKAFVAELTLEEKAWMVTGQPGPCVGNVLPIPRLNFSGLCLQNGPQGIEEGTYSSVFVSGVSAAASWDRKLLYDRAYAIAEEHKAKGTHVILGPVAGPLGRSAYNGRSWEGFAADPYLTGVCMEETIIGMQDAGVQANAKHFIGNEQETQRNPTYAPDANATTYIQDSVSSNIDDRTLHEIYMWPFANSVRSGAASFMCSYNRVNGLHSCQNSWVLNHLLKTELGFQGYVMSDWGATHSGVASIESGMDMTMPGGFTLYGEEWTQGSYFGKNLTAAVENGTVDMSRLDDMVIRTMTPYYLLGQDQDFPSVDSSVGPLNVDSPPDTWLYDWTFTGTSNRDVRGNHSILIRQHGADSTVLLKNENGALPLSAPKSIAVFGNDAGPITQGWYNNVNYEYGVLPNAGGSGTCRFSSLSNPLDAITRRAEQDGALVQSWLNNTLLTTKALPDLWIGQLPDVCLVFLKSWAEENKDRDSLELDWNGSAVVEAVAAYCNNTVVVTHSNGINVMPFADHPNVTAILAAHYPGEQAGNAIVDLLYGDVNPSAKLPYVIAYNESDYNAPVTTAVLTNGTYDWQSWFDEKLEVGYRHFDANSITPRYEFGFGLSYTTFSLSGLSGNSSTGNLTALPPAGETLPGGNPALWNTVYTVTADVTNTGDVAGYAVPQLYAGFPDSTPEGTPPSQLRGFDKIWLEAGETKTATFDLMRRDVSYWDVVAQDWRIPSGDFTFNVGFSSRDFHANTTVALV
ncbi:glycoside hydrolase superfamily [Pestalotiopsis sp. NC0098]|nr:glycoside hydrolase superfamily [Pestalotiopsis sp. NC0098]